MAVKHLGNGMYVGLSTDTKPTVPAGYRYYSTDTGDWEQFDGTYWWIQSLGPLSQKHVGFGPCGGSVTNGEGMLISMTASTGVGSQAFLTDATNGKYANYTTSTTSGNKGGARVNQPSILREYNPRIKMKLTLNNTTLCRYYLGFAPTAELTSDDPLNTLDGFLFGYIATAGSNYLIMHNDGSGATVSDDTGTASTGVREVRLVCDNTNSRFSWSIDGGAYTHVTANIPRTSQAMTTHFTCETAEAAVKSFRLYNAFIQADK